MISTSIKKRLGIFTLSALILQGSFALGYDQIIRPYQSVRSSAMGSTRIMTGLYEENFFGNPARAAANPKWKVELLDVSFETGASTISALKDVLGSGDTFQKISDTQGDNLHGRLQTAMPAIYVPIGRMSYALALLTSSQFDMGLRKSYNVDALGIIDIAPAFTASYQLLEERNLAVGLTLHYTYRLSTKNGFSVVDLVRGVSVAPTQSGGQGASVDFDVGTTYQFKNFTPADWKFGVGGSINNGLNGKFSNLRITPIKSITSLPKQQPRTYNLGVSAARDKLAFFRDALFSFEVTDIGNNDNGSMFRTLHMGGELRYSLFIPRFGINQGYLCGGLGFDFGFFELDLATYGEEMTLNPGGLEDRRYALRLAFQI